MKRNLIFWALIIAFVWFVNTRIAEIRNILFTMATGIWGWVLVAALVQVVYCVVFVASYQSAFETVGVKSRLRDLLPVWFASLFINIVVPIGGASGTALFVDDAARRGQSPTRVANGALLQLIIDFISFAFVLVIGLVYLFTQHQLKFYESFTAGILFAAIFFLSGVLLLGLWSPVMLKRLLSWLQRTTNSFLQRFKRPTLLADDWAETTSAEFIVASSAIASHPGLLIKTFFILLVTHVLHLITLYALFLAYGVKIDLWALVAGYGIGVLFWLISITPQGIGVVEGVMTLVFSAQGVPPDVAAAVSLAFRGMTFWLPLLVGFILLRRVKTFGASERSATESWGVRIIAILVGLMGLLNVLSAVTPSLQPRLLLLEQYSPLEISQASRLTSALAGYALLLLAFSLWRRKRVAWLATIVVLVISSVSHLVKGLDYEEALVGLALAVGLWIYRDHFHARSDRPSIKQGLVVLATATAFTLVYGTIGFYLLDRHYSVKFGFWTALRQTVVMFTQFYNPGLYPLNGFGRFFADSIYVVGIVTISYAALMLLRPVLLREPASPAERLRAREITEAYGHSSLARLALLDDKAYYFSQGGSLVAFTVKGRTAVALGDPIGPEQDAAQAIAGFKDYCAQNDWDPAFYQTIPDYLDLYKAAGFAAQCLGHEAIVDLHTFSLEGSAVKPVRNAWNHVKKSGCQFHLFQPPLSAEMVANIQSVSDEWLAMMKGSEKRFSLGWFTKEYVSSVPIATVETPDGRVAAFASLLPEYQRKEVALDLIRRKQEVEPGTMDFLFVSLFLWAREQGYDTFNLGLSALAGVGEHAGDPALERLEHFFYENVNQFYNFKGLHEFKEKFHPAWSPRYLIYPSLARLANVWIAVLQVNSGGEVLPLWRLKR